MRKKNFILLAITTLFFFIFDRIIKNLYFLNGKSEFLKFQENHNFLYFFQGKFFYFLIPLIFILLVFLALKSYQQKEYFKTFSLSLIFVGGFSNFLDRLLHGFVLDYFSFFSLWTFNLADVMILVGSLLFLWQLLKAKK